MTSVTTGPPAPDLDSPVASDDLEIGEVEAFLQDLASLAASSVAPDASVSCGITVQIDGQQTTVACSDTWASQLDEIQYEVDIGPCLHSLRTLTVVRVDDVQTESSWPSWRERAQAAGVGSALAVPVPLFGHGPRGALNFYARTPHAFDEQAAERATEMARRATRAIQMVASLVELERNAEQLRAALGSRSIIDQALGIIMGQSRCDADEAFVIIRKASHNRNVKLRDVAAEIVRSATGKAPVPPPIFRQKRSGDV
jgi:transcriptional regulator with GAF, ATPase, and Fis domain